MIRFAASSHGGRQGGRSLLRGALLSLFLLSVLSAPGQTSKIESDQKVIFFPSLTYPVDKENWEIKIQGCVFEPEKRPIALTLLRGAMALDGIQVTKAENRIFSERARLFMVDNERGAKIVIRIGDKRFKAGKSAPNGHFSKTFRFSNSEIEKLQASGTGFQMVLPPGDERLFGGNILFFKATGPIVISDIDDTIKITEVKDSHSILRNTFLRPFQPVPGMRELYHAWAERDQAQFCYVSASPWQLFSPLAAFVSSNGFPTGPFFLKQFRLKDESFRSLFQSPEQYKPGVIEPLFELFPHRNFILVGDSGEKDPEIYAALAKKYPERVAHILIREVDDGTDHPARFKAVFEGISSEVWKTFREPAEISSLRF